MIYPELEVGFHYRDERKYAVELRFDDPDNQAENFSGPFSVEFDWERLRTLTLDPVKYGAALSVMFFHDARIKETFAFAFASAKDRPLRIRLYLNPATPRLHDVIWETLQDPSSAMGAPLAINERVFLSRFLNSSDFRPVHLRRRDALRALVAIANPVRLRRQRIEDRLLPPIDVEREWDRVRTSLGTVGTEKLAEGGKASLNHIIGTLREGFDILFLVCHGALVNGEPLLWLEDEKGDIARVMGIDLALRLKNMHHPPRLVVLASCQSAGVGEQARSDDKGALSALAPKLAEAGIPAIIAMQDNVRMDTSGKFFTVFFKQLIQDGQIDRAMTIARSAIYPDQSDWWIPVLITRLKRGRIWYEHDISSDKSFKKLGAVVDDIKTSDCTPILGPGVVAPILGVPDEIARRWAERYDFPMAPHERDSLPQVAQYLAYHQSRNFLHSELKERIRKFILDTYSDKLPEEIRNSATPPQLSKLITCIGKQLRQDDEHDLLRMMAELPFPIYITANRDNLLFDALKEAGKEPKIDICRWAVFEEEQENWPQSVFVTERGYVPTVQRPLVFHLFGNMSYPDTLVIAEDDYFDYLIGVNKNRRNTFGSHERATGREPFPQPITRALAKRGLLFLGFRISDWEFRTLFRSILAQEGRRLKKSNVSVSAQLEPSDDEFLEPQGARSYIEEYFLPNKLEVYWGSAKDFVEQLQGAWRRAGSPVPTEEDLNR